MGESRRQRRERHQRRAERNAAKKAQAASRMGPLLSLPGEIKNRIYEHVMAEMTEIIIHPTSKSSSVPLALVEWQTRCDLRSYWHPNYFLSLSVIKCEVHNFRFHVVCRTLSTLLRHFPDAKLKICLSFGEDQHEDASDVLNEWLAECQTGVFSPIERTYSFAKPLISFDGFRAFDRSVLRKHWGFRASREPSPEWVKIRSSFLRAAEDSSLRVMAGYLVKTG